jgi:hypothetical protein
VRRGTTDDPRTTAALCSPHTTPQLTNLSVLQPSNQLQQLFGMPHTAVFNMYETARALNNMQHTGCCYLQQRQQEQATPQLAAVWVNVSAGYSNWWEAGRTMHALRRLFRAGAILHWTNNKSGTAPCPRALIQYGVGPQPHQLAHEETAQHSDPRACNSPAQSDLQHKQYSTVPRHPAPATVCKCASCRW